MNKLLNYIAQVFFFFFFSSTGGVQGTTDAMQELQAAENRQFWITSSEGTPEKRPNYKGTLEASQPR